MENHAVEPKIDCYPIKKTCTNNKTYGENNNKYDFYNNFTICTKDLPSLMIER